MTWQPIPEYEGYEVSDEGVVRRTLPTATDGDGYTFVVIDRRKVTIHALVLRAFTGPRPDGQEVRHLNDDRTDNRLSNLAYGTRSDNQRDAVRNGRHYKAARTHCKRGHEYTPDNTRIRPGDGARICRACERKDWD